MDQTSEQSKPQKEKDTMRNQAPEKSSPSYNRIKKGIVTKGESMSKKRSSSRPKKGNTSELYFERYFTEQGVDPLKNIETVKASSAIKDTDGSTVFEMKEIEVPKDWSQLSIDILVSKYLRKAGVPKTGHEVSLKQVVKRIARTIRKQGEKQGHLSSESAQTFEDELSFLLVHQYGAFNSPVWFNCGLWHEYGVKGSGGNFAWDRQKQSIKEVDNNYEYPQCSACFIQSVDDDLMSIFDLIKNEARLFKYGSGTGTNFSKIRERQEKLSGGGSSSGLMSFLEVLDRGAGATKSGGTTRRAAKMVCLDMDHPEIEEFINWKQREERKVAALIAGGYESDFNGEAYRTVSGQNSNNSIRVNDQFMRAVEKGDKWETTKRTNGEVVKTYQARDLWKKVAKAAWSCADPGIQFDTTINDWHTCKNTDRIYASNPCSEYMFLDNSACNLASLNLVKFLKEDGTFDIEGYQRACRLFVVAQEILVDTSSYPTKLIAQNSHDYRPLGLGYANLGTLLMIQGIPYDSDQGRSWAGALTAIMCGQAYATSAELAKGLGSFPGFGKNRDSMLKVMGKHKKAAHALKAVGAPEELIQTAKEDWDLAYALGEKHGYRNAQVTVLAPTGTIGLLMDCDTTGIEPDFALVKFKKLAGGGYFKIINQSVPKSLANLGYTQPQITNILEYVLGTQKFGSDEKVQPMSRPALKKKGLKDADIDKMEEALPGTFDLSGVFTRFAVGDETLDRLKIPKADYEKPTFNLLDRLGFTAEQIALANEVICGTMTVEGAPHLKEKHLAVFDCANKCGSKGERYIAPMGHVQMMAVAQPFLSGAISKTVNMPTEATVEEIQEVYMKAWQFGLKAIALYRDGCKHSQPLSTQSSSDSKDNDEQLSEKIAKAANLPYDPVRRRLPAKRRGFTQEAAVGGHKIYIRTGEYEDGNLGEIFIDMHKEGAAYRSMMNCFAIAVSLGLQYGVPLREYVDKFTFTRFEPSGLVEGHPNVKMSTSLVDYIFRVIGMEYLGRTDFLQVKPKTPPVDLTTEKGAAQKIYPKNPSLLIEKEAKKAAMPRKEIQPMASQVKTSSQGGLSGHLADMMGDAPPCDSCGHTTVRNGSCYRCLNCGNSMGCS